jgi:hypothetical protein
MGSKRRRRKKWWLNFIVLSVSITSASITGLFIYLFAYRIANPAFSSSTIDPLIFGLFGDVVGGFVGTILGFLTVYLLFKTYKSQKKELKETQVALDDQKNEAAFFNMLSSLREIVNTMEGHVKSEDPSPEGSLVIVLRRFKGREYLFRAFKAFKKNFTYGNLHEDLMFNPDTNKLHSYSEIETDCRSDDGNIIIKRVPNRKYEIDVKHTKSEVATAFKKFLYDHKHNLDHYFRFIQSLINFIEEIEYEKDKARYLEILKAQLSNYEMGLIFYNSLNDVMDENLYPMDFLEHMDESSLVDYWHHFLYSFTDFKFLSLEERKEKQAYRKYAQKKKPPAAKKAKAIDDSSQSTTI